MLAQNYRVKREVCSECRHFTTKAEPAEWAVKLWPEDLAKQRDHLVYRGKRCGIGGFSVKSTATCNLFDRVPEASCENQPNSSSTAAAAGGGLAGPSSSTTPTA